MVEGEGGGGSNTLFRLERRRAYSSRTSCSRGVQDAGGAEGGGWSAIEGVVGLGFRTCLGGDGGLAVV